MSKKNKKRTPRLASGVQHNNIISLARNDKQRKQIIELNLQSASLTKKDIGTWRKAWQAALDPEQPNRFALYNVYTDVVIDNHLSGCIDQRKGMTLRKPFFLKNTKGEIDLEATRFLQSSWFQEFVSLCLDSRYWGHSLIEFQDLDPESEHLRFSAVGLVPRTHVIPEYGIFTRDPGDEPANGISYREGEFLNWCIEVGAPKDLGLLLKCAPQSLSKKNMLAYWDVFGEIFGMPIRVAKTISSDPKEQAKVMDAISGVGAATSMVVQEGTEIEIKEASKGDAYNVYDKRIDRCNSEISKALLNQTMTIDSGSSLSQSETHLEVFENVCAQDADMVANVVNDKLLPLMVRHGFPLKGYYFSWDNTKPLTPKEERELEKMLLGSYDIDPKYFEDKYKIPVMAKKASTPPANTELSRPFFS